ncbi:MAG: glycosyltransferase, partial [Hyphomonas sp.]|nr:glycosyltransferase [Hyphomonas sp.]
MRRPDVLVLLSTYNGERWLDEQIDSLAAQSIVPSRLLLRDDGSTDQTVDVVKRRRAPFPIDLIEGPNIGVRASFMELLILADAEVVFLCDQDDVWDADKIERGLCALAQAPSGEAAMYCSRLRIVDADLAPRTLSPAWPRPPGFGNALVENIASGCTIALNRAAAKRVRPPARIDDMIMHDWWIYLVSTAFGRVIYDPEPRISYRIHGSNSVGLARSRFEGALRRVKRLRTRNTIEDIVRQAEAFLQTYGPELTPAQRDLAQAVAGSRAGRARA